MIKLKSVKKLANNTVLMKSLRTHLDLLLKQKSFYNIKIKTYSHNCLNSSKCVVRSPDPSLCSVDEIKTTLRKQGVTETWNSKKNYNPNRYIEHAKNPYWTRNKVCYN